MNVEDNHGVYMALDMFSFLSNNHEMDSKICPPTDGMVFKHMNEMTHRYEHDKVLNQVQSNRKEDNLIEGDSKNL